MLIQLSPAKYEVQVATRCNGGLVSTISPIANYEIGIAPKDSTEDVLTYYNEDEKAPEPVEYEEPEEEDGLDILNTPFTVLIDTDALPDSLKANLPQGGSLPTLPENPTIEQLKDAVKARKTTGTPSNVRP